MFHLTLSPELTSRCPEYRGAAVLANVTNTPYSEGLWQEIDAFTQTLRASETARRRLLRGLELYKIDMLVDLINLVSLRTGYSIGGFDADKIQGTDLCLGVGPFEGIGRGVLNIEGLPVWRDALGGIGTPTSDNERTKMDVGTRRILAIINGYDGDEQRLNEAAGMTQELLRKYAKSDGGKVLLFG